MSVTRLTKKATMQACLHACHTQPAHRNQSRAVVLVLTGSQCSSIHPSSAKRRLEWMRCGSHPERCVDEKIPRPPRPCGQHDYGACQRQAPTGRIRHHRPEHECCRTVVKDDGRDWSRGVNVMTRFSFQPGLARKTVCSDQQNMAMWL